MKHISDSNQKILPGKLLLAILSGMLLSVIIAALGAFLIYHESLQPQQSTLIGTVGLCAGIMTSAGIYAAGNKDGKWLRSLIGGGGYFLLIAVISFALFDAKPGAILAGLAVTSGCSAAVGLVAAGRGNMGHSASKHYKRRKLYNLHK